MDTIYVTSQYPAQSETFIAREMRELSAQGHDLTIARLRWSDTGTGLTVPGADVLRLMWTPLDWLLGVLWGLTHNRRALLRIGEDVFSAPLFSVQWARLAILGVLSLALARHLDSRPVDHLRAHFLDTEAIAAHWLSHLLDVPYSLTAHTLVTRFPAGVLDRVVEDAAFCATENEKVGRLIDKMDVSAPPVPIIRNGISSPETKRRPSSTGPPWKLLAVGRLVKKKGFDVLLSACRLLQHWVRPFRCTIIGDGPERTTLESRAHTLNIASHVDFQGAQPNDRVLHAMHHHDLLVMPSRPTQDGERDGIPTVLIEALSLGLPVIASAFSGIPELVQESETGKLVRSNSAPSLAQGICRFFDRPQQFAEMGRRGQQHVRQNFNLKREVQLLHRLVQNSTRPHTQ